MGSGGTDIMRFFALAVVVLVIQGCADGGPTGAGTTDPTQYAVAVATETADQLIEVNSSVGSLGALAYSGGTALAAITEIGAIGGPLAANADYDATWILVGQVSGDPDGFSTSGSILLHADLANGTLTGIEPDRFEVDATFVGTPLSGEVTYLGAVVPMVRCSVLSTIGVRLAPIFRATRLNNCPAALAKME